MKTHKQSEGMVRATCLVAHGDGHGGCFQCTECRRWVRPQNLNEECPGMPVVVYDKGVENEFKFN